jgi:phage shock protein B
MDNGTIAILSSNMDDLTDMVVVLVGVLAPVWLVAQIIKARSARRLSTADAALIAQIANIADRMDRRMEAVERILDADAPAWRHNNTMTGDRYGQKVG